MLAQAAVQLSSMQAEKKKQTNVAAALRCCSGALLQRRVAAAANWYKGALRHRRVAVAARAHCYKGALLLLQGRVAPCCNCTVSELH